MIELLVKEVLIIAKNHYCVHLDRQILREQCFLKITTCVSPFQSHELWKTKLLKGSAVSS